MPVSSERGPQTEEYLQARQLRGLKPKRTGRASGGGGAARTGNGNHEKWPVHLVAEIDTDRPDRRCVANAHADGMRKIVQFVGAVIEALLGISRIEDRLRRTPAKRYAVHFAVHISAVVKQSSSDACSDVRQMQRKAEFLIEDQQCLSTHGKAGERIARAGLIQTEAAQRGTASREKPLGKRNEAWRRGLRWRRKSEGDGVAIR